MGGKISDLLTIKTKYENASKAVEYTKFLENEAKEKARIFQLNKENSTRELGLALGSLNENVKDSRRWGASQEKLRNIIGEEFKSPDIVDVMENHGLKLNDDLTVSAENVSNSLQQLENNSKAAEMTRKISGIVGGINRKFETQADDIKKVGVNLAKEGVPDILDALDINAYITSHPEEFREQKFDESLVPEEERGKIPFLPGDENIYADAFRQPIRTLGGIDYGTWDKSEYDDLVKARAKVSTEEGSDIAQAIRGNMDNEAFIQGTDGENLETPHMRSYFGGDITELKGDAKKFDDPEARDDYNDLTTNGFIEFFKGQENVNENIKHMIGIADEQNDMDVKKAVVANILGYLQGTDFDTSTGTMTPAQGMTNSPIHGFNIDARDVQTISFGTLSSPGYTDGNMFEYQAGSGMFGLGGGTQLWADRNSGTEWTENNDKLLANKFDTWATINSTDTEALKRGYEKLNAILVKKKKDAKKEEIDESLDNFNVFLKFLN